MHMSDDSAETYHLYGLVMLQALREEPPLNAKCKDKFLIQSTLITTEKETMALHDIVRLTLFPTVHVTGRLLCFSGRRQREERKQKFTSKSSE
jgi:hypothetical protein